MTITFIHGGHSFLPEIQAYTKLFQSKGVTCQFASPGKNGIVDTDVEWHFMGVDKHTANNGRIKIHEYTSASTAPFTFIKDLGKKILSVKPEYRLFLNEFVRDRFSFGDNIPFGYRDMGVSADWVSKDLHTPAFDFVYIGDLSPSRRPEDLLNIFAGGMMKHRLLLVISHNYESLQKTYCSFSNIKFEGPYEHDLIREKLLEARYGINYIIDESPYNQQTSTKFLEYAACGLRVVSTRYEWIEHFQNEYGGNYYFLNPDLSNFNWKGIEEFPFKSPDLTEWTWEKQIERSGVLEFLDGRFGFL